MSKRKQNALLLLVLAGLLVTLLAMSLPGLTLLPGRSYAFEMSQPATAEISELLSQGGPVFNILRGLIAITVVLLPVYVIYSLFTAEGRKRLVYNILLIVMIFALAEHLRTHPPEYDTTQQDQMSADAQDLGQSGASDPIPVFSADPPQWLSILILFGGSLIVAAIIMSSVWYLRERQQSGSVALERLAEEAQIAIVSLYVGDDFRTTILRCYWEMTRVLEEERGMTRERAMTPREFEVQLLDKGLPQGSIRTLTRLFEQVRYGHVSVDTQETDMALSCLNAIVTACQAIGNRDE